MMPKIASQTSQNKTVINYVHLLNLVELLMWLLTASAAQSCVAFDAILAADPRIP
jgi:hypothetical protein